MPENHIRKIGVLVKPHGLQGELVLKLESGLAPVFGQYRMRMCFLSLHGSEVPFKVEKHAPLNAERLKLALHGIDTVDKAEQLRGVEVGVKSDELPSIQRQESWVGFTIVLADQTVLGEVVDQLEQTSQVLLVVQGEQGELLIPLVDDFITGHDSQKMKLFMSLPEGLVDL